MKSQINRGDKVCWPCGGGTTIGLVVDTYNHPSGNASQSMPASLQNNKALLIELQDGSKVLKLENEVKKESL